MPKYIRYTLLFGIVLVHLLLVKMVVDLVGYRQVRPSFRFPWYFLPGVIVALVVSAGFALAALRGTQETRGDHSPATGLSTRKGGPQLTDDELRAAAARYEAQQHNKAKE